MITVPELEKLLDANDQCRTTECRECSESECPCDVLRDVLFPADGTTDTLRALIDTVKAAKAVLHGEDELTRLGLADAVRYDALHHALAPLFPEDESAGPDG